MNEDWVIPERRWKRVRLTRDAMFLSVARLFNRKATAISSNLPEDVEYRGIAYRFDIDCFEIAFEHPTWENVPPGEEPPLFDLVITEIAVDALSQPLVGPTFIIGEER